MDVTTRLRPGDTLLYGPVGFFGWLIKFHTGGPCAHVEVYMGNGQTIASRDGAGVNRYPLRLAQLVTVLRPTRPFNADAAWFWFDWHGKGQKYGWADLLNFCGYRVNAPGMVCSPCATYVLRAGGVPVFGTVEAEHIAPNDFLLSELLTDVSSDVLGSPIGHTPAAAATAGPGPKDRSGPGPVTVPLPLPSPRLLTG